MSAINLSRLHTQLDLILPTLGDIEIFLKGLREIYSFYADHTHPLGNPPSGVFTLAEFNTPVILNREVLLLLSPACRETPDHMLALADRLWQEPQVEFRQLSAQILGKLPESKTDAVLERIRAWSEASPNLELLPYLHHQASVAIRRHSPQKWLDLLSEWDASTQPSLSRLAIEGVLPLIDDHDFENLPAIFTYLTPLFFQLDSERQYDLLTVLKHLARRSEVETVHFLQKAIELSSDPNMARFIRRSLVFFTSTNQEYLKEILRKHS
jgi:hypothetical protein